MSQVPFFSFIEEIFLGSKCSYLIWLLKHQEKCTIREAGWNGDGFLSGSLTRICVCVTLIHIHVQSSCCSGNRCANSENEQQVDSTGTFSPITVIVYFYFSSTHTNSPMPCSLTLLAALFSFFHALVWEVNRACPSTVFYHTSSFTASKLFMSLPVVDQPFHFPPAEIATLIRLLISCVLKNFY